MYSSAYFCPVVFKCTSKHNVLGKQDDLTILKIKQQLMGFFNAEAQIKSLLFLTLEN